MADESDHGEFWLPPEFLTDDDILMDFKPAHMKSRSGDADAGVHFPFDFSSGLNSFGPHSGLSSPVESMVSSESEEEELIAGLTRKMAHSTLHDDLWKADSGFGNESQKSWGLSGSPQSTLCGVMGGCGCKQGSSRGSPNSASQVSSPPAPASDRKDGAWDLLYAAAGEIVRMRMMEEANAFYQSRGFQVPSRIPSPVSAALDNNPSPNLGFPSNQSLSYHQLQIAKFQQLKQQQMIKQAAAVEGQTMACPWSYQKPQSHILSQPRARNGDRQVSLSASAWPTLQQSVQQQQQQQQPNSGMRAVFLGNTGSKRESVGTGVFLPRRIGSPTETRKKSGCSTVLLPDRVVQALNLNLEAMDTQPQLQNRFNGGLTSDFDAAVKYRNNFLMGHQTRNLRPPSAAATQELRLPQEWTY